MKNSPKIFLFASLCLGILIGPSGCGKEAKLTLAKIKLDFDEGKEETQLVAVTATSRCPAACQCGA